MQFVQRKKFRTLNPAPSSKTLTLLVSRITRRKSLNLKCCQKATIGAAQEGILKVTISGKRSFNNHP